MCPRAWIPKWPRSATAAWRDRHSGICSWMRPTARPGSITGSSPRRSWSRPGWPRTGTTRKLVPSAQSPPRILMRSRSARKSSTPRLPRPPADAEGLCAVGEGYSGRLGSAGYVLAALGCCTRWPLALTDHESSCACPSPTLDCWRSGFPLNRSRT